MNSLAKENATLTMPTGALRRLFAAVIVPARRVGFVLLAVAPGSAGRLIAQASPNGALPQPRAVVGPVAVSRGVLRTVSGLRELTGARVLVNDFGSRRLVILDSALTKYVVVLDSALGPERSYGARNGGLIPFGVDTTLFYDAASRTLLPILPDGSIGSAIALPFQGHAAAFVAGGYVRADGQNLIYVAPPGRPAVSVSAGGSAPAALNDSSPLVRANLLTRVVDTLGFLRTPRREQDLPYTPPDGAKGVMRAVRDPVLVTDGWAMTSDGSIGIVRGGDYHVDWIRGGRLISSPRMDYPWHRLSDEDKRALVDSGRAFVGAHPTKYVATLNGREDDGFVVDSVVGAAELPDYIGPFASPPLADADGHIWVLPVTTIAPIFVPPAAASRAPATYDVVDSNGRIVKRVTIPAGTSIAGFGKGTIYLVEREGPGVSLARFRIPQ